MSYVPTKGVKTCRGKCGEKKSVWEFRVFRMNGDPDRAYRRPICMDCEAAYSREWRKRHPGYDAAKAREYRQIKV